MIFRKLIKVHFSTQMKWIYMCKLNTTSMTNLCAYSYPAPLMRTNIRFCLISNLNKFFLFYRINYLLSDPHLMTLMTMVTPLSSPSFRPSIIWKGTIQQLAYFTITSRLIEEENRSITSLYFHLQYLVQLSITWTRAVDPHSLFADPDPAVFLIADPDPTA